uniref:Foie-gras_1 domain-containing protein n=1 Tax=Macrostomum lignano TaxID=282301 RepID=A0A1I8FJZ0_9PLAT
PWAQHLPPSPPAAGQSVSNISISFTSSSIRLFKRLHRLQISSRRSIRSTTAGRQPIPATSLDPDGGVGGGAPGGGVVGHGAWLSADDHNRLRVMILELVNRALMPWVEKTLKLLNEQIASRMRGKGFLGGAKKWFSVGGGGGSGGSGSGGGAGKSGGQHAGSAGASSVVCGRYADLAFLFQQYEVAHQAYQQLKKDFQADAAFLHYAGTMEMAALSAFMQEGTSQRNYPHPYMENAIATYLQNCKNQLLATRGTFLSAEALKTKKMYAEAAVQYIKMTTEAPSLLEQAAHCYLRMAVPHVRKFAFHLILAGHRFSKAAQRAHSLRCYRAALRVYRDRGWTLARTTSTWSSLSIRPPYASWSRLKDSAYRLLRHDSRQSPASSPLSSEILCTCIASLFQLWPVRLTTASLAGPCLCCLCEASWMNLSIPARGVHFQDADLCHPEWSGLERALLEAATGRSAPPSFRPSPAIYAAQPAAQIPLILRDVCLLWSLRRTNVAAARPRPMQTLRLRLGWLLTRLRPARCTFA